MNRNHEGDGCSGVLTRDGRDTGTESACDIGSEAKLSRTLVCFVLCRIFLEMIIVCVFFTCFFCMVLIISAVPSVAVKIPKCIPVTVSL